MPHDDPAREETRMTQDYSQQQPLRSEIDALSGPALLDFGTNWCGHCRASQPVVEQALQAHAGVRHLRVEDGSGRALGRSYGVTRWPTLVFLRDGRELARLVRPLDVAQVQQALALIDTAPG